MQHHLHHRELVQIGVEQRSDDHVQGLGVAGVNDVWPVRRPLSAAMRDIEYRLFPDSQRP
jgi:hypothetical protein